MHIPKPLRQIPTAILLLLAVTLTFALRFRSQHRHDLWHVHAQIENARATNPRAFLPDPRLTPGAIDPRITQSNIASTICRFGYTREVRPSFEISNTLKHHVMDLYHVHGSIHDYELDHLIPLELGGCPACIANLWPQPWTSPGAHEKDEVEHYLRDRVCHHLMSLSEAQRLIASDWYSVYLAINR